MIRLKNACVFKLWSQTTLMDLYRLYILVILCQSQLIDAGFSTLAGPFGGCLTWQNGLVEVHSIHEFTNHWGMVCNWIHWFGSQIIVQIFRNQKDISLPHEPQSFFNPPEPLSVSQGWKMAKIQNPLLKCEQNAKILTIASTHTCDLRSKLLVSISATLHKHCGLWPKVHNHSPSLGSFLSNSFALRFGFLWFCARQECIRSSLTSRLVDHGMGSQKARKLFRYPLTSQFQLEYIIKIWELYT